MRKVQALVVAETLVLAVLMARWWQHDDVAPPAVVVPVAQPSDETAAAAAPPDAATTVPPADQRLQRTAAVAGSAGTSSVVLQGRLLGIDPPPKANIVHLSCRRDEEWRLVNVTDEGAYAIANLQPGRWRLLGEVEGCRKFALEHEITDAAIQRLDLTLQPATIVKVFVRTSDGKRLQAELSKLGTWQSLRVLATKAPLSGDLAPTEQSIVYDVGVGRHRQSGDMNQRAEENGDDGVLELDQPPPVHAALLLRHAVLAQQRIEPGQQELHFTVDLADVRAKYATIRLRVVDAQGQPIAKVGIELSTAQGGGGRGATGADGTAVVKDVLPGISQFGLSCKDRMDYTTHLVVPVGGNLDLGDIVLQEPVALRGEIVLADGTPTAASVQWTDLDLWQAPNPLIDRRSGSADGDGKFQLWGTGPHRYLVIARTEAGLVGRAIVDGRAAQREPFRITLGKGTTVWFVAIGPALTTYTAVVRQAEGHPVAVVRIEPRWREQAATLAPGDYTLELYEGERTLLRREPLVVGTTKLRKVLP